LRIGISTLKGLAWPLGKKAVGVSTLAALSMNIPFSTRLVCPVLDARKGEVYAALYDTSEGLPKAVMGDSAMAPEALFAEIARRGLSTSVVFLGSGLEVYSKKVVEALPAAVLATVGRLAFESTENAVDPAGLTPVYLRRSEAEIKFG
jgi:tRNA threonylcarbamoyladenosine biosynthesis protein TsaB